MDKLIPDPPSASTSPYVANQALTDEQALIHASELLRCAMATAYECGDSLNGAHRYMALSVVHLLEMASAMLERSLK